MAFVGDPTRAEEIAQDVFHTALEKIVVYKSDGSYVKTITGTTSNGLIRSNSSLHLDSYEFSVTSGVSYYAEVTVFAKVGTEYDSRTITTSTVKAP